MINIAICSAAVFDVIVILVFVLVVAVFAVVNNAVLGHFPILGGTWFSLSLRIQSIMVVVIVNVLI